MEPTPWLSAVVSALHLLSLGIGLGSVWMRGRALRAVDLPRVFAADNFWGIAGVLWLVTGLARAFGGLEKGTAFYLANPMFHLKMGLYLLAVALEMWPMVSFIRWRIQLSKGEPPDTSRAPTFARINDLEVVVVVAMVFVAAMMARGVGMG